MTMAAAIESRTAEAPARPKASRIARIDITDDLQEAEPAWRILERDGFFTPYQRFDFLSTWQHEVGDREATSPFIVIARDRDGQPLLLLPLAIASRLGGQIASFMGGKHTTFNMPLWNDDFAVDATAADLGALLAAIRTRRAIDVLALARQPRHWRHLPNPFAALPHQPSVNDCPVLALPAGAKPTDLISNSFRKRLRGKERKFQALAGYRYLAASGETEIARLLDWFFRVKPKRMAEQRLPNVFAEPGVETFIRKACIIKRSGGEHIIDLHALECDEEVIALYGGVSDGNRFSMMFNTYTLSDNARYSPGLILIRHIVDYYAGRGYSALDLGIGSDDYKRSFCKSEEPIFDSFIALSGRGRMVAASLATMHRGKHLVKHNPALLKLVQRLRGSLT
jgi:CelD/BcsL family acetyltransferase involved in cellulose biosynthesis